MSTKDGRPSLIPRPLPPPPPDGVAWERGYARPPPPPPPPPPPTCSSLDCFSFTPGPPQEAERTAEGSGDAPREACQEVGPRRTPS